MKTSSFLRPIRSRSTLLFSLVVALVLLGIAPGEFGFLPEASAKAAPPASRIAQEMKAITVGPNVEVSQADKDETHDEVLIAAHPRDANQLVACSMVNRNRLGERKMHTAAYTSNDGGKTWSIGPQIPESGDPVCQFGPDGAVYFGAIGDSTRNDPLVDWHFKLYRSTDNGHNWKQSADFVSGDRPWLAFDNTDGPSRGWMYVTYQSRAGVLDSKEKQLAVSLDLTRSIDSGSTWGIPRAYGVINARRLAHSLPTSMAVLSDGTIAISNWQNLKKSATETDDRTASSYPGDPGPPTCEITVVLVPSDGWKRPKTFKAADKYCSEGPTTRTVDSLAVDTHSEAFKDRLYLAWTDARTGQARIMFAYSADKGETWSTPRVVDDVPASVTHAPDNFMPTLAVNKDGVVGLSWDDRRDNPDNIGYTTRFTASLDGGESWLPSVRVAEQPARFTQRPEEETLSAYASEDDPSTGRQTIRINRSGEFHGGDTAGLTADADGVFHALWADNRNGKSEVYTAPITVRGTVAKYGSVDFSGLVDISGKVAFEIQNIEYDGGKQMITLQGSLRNKSKDSIHGRVVLRALSLASEVGRPSITNADNKAEGPGAVFDFSSSIPAGELKPEQSSGIKTIEFHLAEVRLPREGELKIEKLLYLGFVTMDVQMLGEQIEKKPAAVAANK